MRLPLRFPALRAGLLDAAEGPSPVASYRDMADQLAMARRAARMSQAELAEFLGVTESRLAHWECGDSAPGLIMFLAWAHALGMRVDALNARRRVEPAANARTAA